MIDVPDRYRSARLLVRRDGVPIGFVERAIPRGPLAVSVDDADVQALTEERAPSVRSIHDSGALISVVVATRNRPEQVASCLNALRDLDDSHYEIVIVDNAPSSDATQQLVVEVAEHDSRVRYVAEPRKGVSVARNAGVATSTGSIIAFTDDDTRPDAGWLRGIRDAFAPGEMIGAVTGPVPAAELETESQIIFDRRVWWSSSFAPRTFGAAASEMGPLHPFRPGIIGAGANMAVLRSAFLAVGGFDTRLGPGTRTKAGEDLDLFTRLLLAGYSIVYEPAAMVWHVHRRDGDGLRQQMAGYGMGQTAYLTKMLQMSSSRGALVRRVPAGLSAFAELERREAGAGFPPALRLTHLMGLCVGPLQFAFESWCQRSAPHLVQSETVCA